MSQNLWQNRINKEKHNIMGLLGKLFGNNNLIQEQEEPVTIPEGPGFMIINDAFSISGRGTVVTGKIESGSFRVGQTVIIETGDGTIETTISGVEAFRKTMDVAVAGQNVGLFLANVTRDQINQGSTISGVES